MKYIKRELASELKLSAQEYPIVAILGPRQSGKTTLARKCFPKKAYVSLESLDDRGFAQKDPRGFLDAYKDGAIFDEIQRVPELFSYIQTEVDESPAMGKFILTGSNQYHLHEKISQSLAGRVSLLRLLPLSYSELKKEFKNIELNDLMYQGFYPKIYSEQIRAQKWLQNYTETYIDKDVRLIKNISNLSQFSTFLKMCANRVGQLVNLESIGNDCGISQNTVKSWLSVLESSYIVKLVHPHSKNFNKRLVKTPKIYFYDTGLLCFLLDIKNSNELKAHVLRGGIFESFVLMELQKYFYNKGEKPPLYFWRDKNGHEIDGLIEQGDKIILIEIKSGMTLNSDFFKNIKYWERISNVSNQSYLIYAGEKKQTRDKVTVLPWSELKLLLNRLK